jgi:hypothetical protein
MATPHPLRQDDGLVGDEGIDVEDLVHVDVNKLGKIHAEGGWRSWVTQSASTTLESLRVPV